MWYKIKWHNGQFTSDLQNWNLTATIQQLGYPNVSLDNSRVEGACYARRRVFRYTICFCEKICYYIRLRDCVMSIYTLWILLL
jgi:hypothetical protein